MVAAGQREGERAEDQRRHERRCRDAAGLGVGLVGLGEEGEAHRRRREAALVERIDDGPGEPFELAGCEAKTGALVGDPRTRCVALGANEAPPALAGLVRRTKRETGALGDDDVREGAGVAADVADAQHLLPNQVRRVRSVQRRERSGLRGLFGHRAVKVARGGRRAWRLRAKAARKMCSGERVVRIVFGK